MKFIIEGSLDLITDGIQALDFHHLCSLIPAPNTNGSFLKGILHIAMCYNE